MKKRPLCRVSVSVLVGLIYSEIIDQVFKISVYSWHHKVFYQLKKPISNISRLSLNLIKFQKKYVTKREAKNATFLCRFL